ncbi:MAG: hypothetical protein EOM08_01640 [Clostridia bacterium]|nr:hypothetical protein [Clostridia bacterium]
MGVCMAVSLQCSNCGANVPPDSVRCSYCQSVLARAACPACFGPVFRGMKYCPDCGSRIARQDLTPDSTLHCPRCETHLLPALIADVRVDECNRCGGIWLEREAFQEICEKWDAAALPLDRVEQGLVWTDPEKPPRSNHVTPLASQPDSSSRMYVPCPTCGELMLRKNFAGCSGVIIDWCKPHGYWFDRTELQKVVSFVRSGGMQKSREKEMLLLREEQERLRELKSQPLPGSVDPRVDSASELFGIDTDLVETIAGIIKKLFG